ncbi:hypothetical protein DRE_00499 [Drechslerella stenobrocha 248]|uniref:Uncharacterized protein n=1 Tax=Drechslerella stenobrocha 248 TaxID=1043628 RepID=W7HTR5_9PEZI|nr:hypothetical protein DRE_00499 [Drechslerella stenobrocha 248]
MAALAPGQAWRRKEVVYKTVISFSTVTEANTFSAGTKARTVAANVTPLDAPPKGHIDPPITYSACTSCPVATITGSNQGIISIGEPRENGTHTYVPYYFAEFYDWVFAYTKTVTLYMSLSAVNGQPAAAAGIDIDTPQARTSYTYSLSVSRSVIGVSRSSTVYPSSSRITRTGPVIINSGSGDESTYGYVSVIPTVVTFMTTDYRNITAFSRHTATLPVGAVSTGNPNAAASNPLSYNFPPAAFPFNFPAATSSPAHWSSPIPISPATSSPVISAPPGPSHYPAPLPSAASSSPSIATSRPYFDLYAYPDSGDDEHEAYPIAKSDNSNELQLFQAAPDKVKALSVYVNDAGELAELQTGALVYLVGTSELSSSSASNRRRQKRQGAPGAWSMRYSRRPPPGAIKDGFQISSGSLAFSRRDLNLEFASCSSSSQSSSTSSDSIYGLLDPVSHSNCIPIRLLAVDRSDGSPDDFPSSQQRPGSQSPIVSPSVQPPLPESTPSPIRNSSPANTVIGTVDGSTFSSIFTHLTDIESTDAAGIPVEATSAGIVSEPLQLPSHAAGISTTSTSVHLPGTVTRIDQTPQSSAPSPDITTSVLSEQRTTIEVSTPETGSPVVNIPSAGIPSEGIVATSHNPAAFEPTTSTHVGGSSSVPSPTQSETTNGEDECCDNQNTANFVTNFSGWNLGRYH